MPFASECVAGSLTPLTVALQVIVAAAIGPFVSLSVAARLAVNRAPAFAGVGVADADRGARRVVAERERRLRRVEVVGRAVPLPQPDRAGIELDRVLGTALVRVARRLTLVGVQVHEEEHVAREGGPVADVDLE